MLIFKSREKKKGKQDDFQSQVRAAQPANQVYTIISRDIVITLIQLLPVVKKVLVMFAAVTINRARMRYSLV